MIASVLLTFVGSKPSPSAPGRDGRHLMAQQASRQVYLTIVNLSA